MTKKEKLLISKKIQLEKIPGKGGWTFARLPGIKLEKNNPFGWRKVKGFIDDVEIRQYHLMPMGNGELFLPVKAEIRKKIKKEAGDWIKVILYVDESELEIPKEFVECLKDEPHALDNFKKLSESEKKKYIDWIYAVKTDELKVQRMADSINRIAKGEKWQR